MQIFIRAKSILLNGRCLAILTCRLPFGNKMLKVEKKLAKHQGDFAAEKYLEKKPNKKCMAIDTLGKCAFAETVLYIFIYRCIYYLVH